MRISDWSSDVCSSDLERRRGNYCTGKFSNAAERRLRPSDHSGFRRASRLRRAHVGTGARQLQRNSGRYVAGPGADGRPKKARVAAVAFAAVVATPSPRSRASSDRTSVVSGKSVSVRVDIGGPRIIKNKK